MTPLLPRLTAQAGIRNLPTVGVFHDRGKEELLAVADGMESAALDVEIASVPDIWARPLLFEAALFDPMHPLHQAVVGEWRGLLALLALKERRSFPLSVQNYVLSEEGRSEFEGILVSLLPESCNLLNAKWSEVGIFLLDDEVVGMISPSTLVCTRLPVVGRELDWIQGGTFVDPCPFLNTEERRELAGWLNGLLQAIDSSAGPNANRLHGLLSGPAGGFMNDLGFTGSNPAALSEHRLGIDSPAFACLNRPLANSGGIAKSHVVVQGEREASPVLLLVDPVVAHPISHPDSTISVWGATTLPTALRGLNRNRTMIGQTQLTDAEWRKASDFFTDKLLVFMNSAALDSALRVDGSRSVQVAGRAACACPPLRVELLRYFSAPELARRLRITFDGEKATAFLKLEISGPDETPREVEISRTYGKEAMETVLPAPHTQYWPYLQVKGWEAYFVYSKAAATPAGVSIHGVPVIKGLPVTPEFDRGSVVYEVPHPPEAICFHTDKGEELGVVFIQLPDLQRTHQVEWSVGVDFGTSSTAVSIKQDRSTPARRAAFQQSLVKVITDPGDERLDELALNFIPEAELSAPFLSIYRNRSHPLPGSQHGLSQGNVQFISDQTPDIRVADPFLKKNLKWGDVAEKKASSLFLEQICLQVCAEAVLNGVSKIRWAYSYPSSFSQADSSGYQTQWNHLLTALRTQTGLTHEDGALETESFCTAQYFLHQLQAVPAAGMISIDIGGGTSDLAIWQGSSDQMIFQTSLRIAGHDILLEPLRNISHVLDLLADLTPGDAQASKLGRQEFYIQTDLRISRKSDQLLRALNTHSDHPEVKLLLSIVALGLGGLFYYTGLLLARLARENRYDLSVLPDFYFGGNGSRLFHWAARGQWKDDSAIARVFQKIFHSAVKEGLEGSGLEQKSEAPFKIKLSEASKFEVASGLVEMERKGPRNGVTDTPIVGENFVLEDGDGHWNDLMDADLLGKKIKLVELHHLAKLVEVFNQENDPAKTGLPAVSELEKHFTSTRNQIIQALDNTRHQAARDRHVEPIFISGLRAFLREIATAV